MGICGKSTLVLCLTALFFIGFPSSFSFGQTACSQDLNQGIAAYEQLDYQSAMENFQNALKQNQGCSKQEKIALHLFMAKVYLVSEESDKAVQQMKNALEIDPYLSLDPINTSPKVFSALNQAREQIKQEQQKNVGLNNGNITITPTPRMARRTKAAWSMLTIGAVSGAASAATLGLAFSEDEKQTDAARAGDESARDLHWENTQAYSETSIVLGSLAVASVGTSIYLFLTDGKNRSASNRHSHRFAIAPWTDGRSHGLGVACGF